MASTGQLNESGNATVDVAGRATVALQPLRSFETWEITRWSVASTSVELVPTAKVYRGGISPTNLVEGTYSGNLDSSDTTLELMSGEMLICVWEGADVGSICTFTVGGSVKRAI